MISFASGIALLLGLALSAGCASQYDARHRYEDGWRASDVLKVAPTPNQLESAGIDCSKSTVQSLLKDGGTLIFDICAASRRDTQLSWCPSMSA
jgi:hypothetical protein